MAQTDLDTVKDNLPPEAASAGWDDSKITDLLAAGLTTSRVVLSWWSQRAAQTANFVNVSESGSSRSLSDVHKQAMAMLKWWTDKVQVEENPPEPEVEVHRRISFHRATRV